MPHGHCYLWQPVLLYLHIISDSVIALSYYSIPFALVYIVHKRKDVQFGWIYYLFGAFIFLCGTTHLVNIWTIWNPDYWLDGWLKSLTAVVSVFTAIIIWPLIPKLLKIPSQEQLMNLNNQLEQEISNHKETELMLRKALRNVEDQRYALDASSIVTAANVEGKITYVNDKLCEISGYQKSELLGKNHSILSSQTHPKSFWRDMYRCVANGMPWRSEVCNRAKDGKIYWVDSTIIAQTDDHGKIDRYISIRSDITERKQAEEIIRRQNETLEDKVNLRTTELQKAKDIAVQANKAKSEFLANMSHELRTPMHAILSFSNFGIKKIESAPSEKLQKYFEKIHESGNRLLFLVNDLLDLAKMEVGRLEYKMQEVNLANIIQNCIEEQETRLEEEKLRLQFNHPDINVSVKVDNERIHQVIRNLLSNAIKFSPKDSNIFIQLAEEKLPIEDGEQFIDKQSLKALNCSVRDEGKGIPKKELDTIFEKFVQSSATNTGAGGTGLGLSICKEIIEAHKGKIWAENTSQGGAVFTFSIPY